MHSAHTVLDASYSCTLTLMLCAAALILLLHAAAAQASALRALYGTESWSSTGCQVMHTSETDVAAWGEHLVLWCVAPPLNSLCTCKSKSSTTLVHTLASASTYCTASIMHHARQRKMHVGEARVTLPELHT